VVKLSQGWHKTRLELDWYPEAKGLVNAYIKRFCRYDLYVCVRVITLY